MAEIHMKAFYGILDNQVFIAARNLLARVFGELAGMYLVYGIDICLSSCSDMSDSCSGVIACS